MIFLIGILVISLVIVSYFKKELEKNIIIRARLVEFEYEGSPSDNLGIISLLTPEIAEKVDLKKKSEIEKKAKIEKYLKAVKKRIEKIPRAANRVTIDISNFHLEEFKNEDMSVLSALFNGELLGKIDIHQLDLKEKVFESRPSKKDYPKKKFPSRIYLESSDKIKSPRSFVFIPTYLVDVENGQLKIPSLVKKEIIFSKIIEEDLIRILTDLEQEGIYQVYFIPFSGFVRILNNIKDLNAVEYYKERFFGSQNFADRVYFTKTIGKNDIRISNPYIDRGGFGIVITYTIFIHNKNLDIIGMIGIDRTIKDIKEILKKTKVGASTIKDFQYGIHPITIEQCSNCHSRKDGFKFDYKYVHRNFENEIIARAIIEAMKDPKKASSDKYNDPITGSTVYLLEIEGGKEIVYFLFNPRDVARKYKLLFVIYVVSIVCIIAIIFIAVRLFLSSTKVEKTHTEVMSHLNGGLIVIDGEGKIKFNNQKFGELIEETRPKNKNFLNRYLTEQSRAEYEDLFDKSNKGFEFAGKIKRADGTVFPAIITSSAIHYPGISNPQMLIIIPSDQLERAIGAKFVHSFSHTLKTPASGILLLADLLRRKRSQPKFDHYYSLMKQQVEEFRLMVTNLLGFSKLDLHGSKPQKSINNLAAILRSVAKPFREKAIKKGLEFIENIPESLMTRVDSGMFRVVFNNLLENALKYTYKGKITINAAETSKEVEISIMDTGIGVSEDERDKIFEKFYRGNSPDVQNIDGIGIGLYLSRKYIELHGGSLKYEPNIEKIDKRIGLVKKEFKIRVIEKKIGSEFTVKIPKE
jgi:signal transduction histidine kinase